MVARFVWPDIEMTPALFFLPKVKAFGGTYILVQIKGSASFREDTASLTTETSPPNWMTFYPL